MRRTDRHCRSEREKEARRAQARSSDPSASRRAEARPSNPSLPRQACRCAALLLGLSAAACRTLEPTPILALAESAPSFPAQAEDEHLVATALLPTNQAETFGVDLDERGVLAVGVRLGLSGNGWPALTARSIDAALVLSDGTTLPAIQADRAGRNEAELCERLALLALPVGRCVPFERAPSRFLYFRLAPEARVRGRYALLTGAPVYREVDLLDSLLVLRIDSEDGVRELRMGLAAGRYDAGA